MREASGVYLDRGILEFHGERVGVSGLVAEALAHLIAALNMVPQQSVFGDYRLKALHLFHRGEEVARLTRTEAALLRVLMAHPNSSVPPATFLRMLYGDRVEAPQEPVLAVFICKLRRKLRECEVALHIEVDRGIGYYLQ